LNLRSNFPEDPFIMPLKLKECTDQSTFSRIIDCQWSAYYNPYHPYMQILFPVFGGAAKDREAAIQESKERQWQWHSGDATSHWFYVEDDDREGEILGGAQWHVHEKNPFEGEQKGIEAYCRFFYEVSSHSSTRRYLKRNNCIERMFV